MVMRAFTRIPMRCYSLQEFGAKKLLANYAIRVQKCDVAKDPETSFNIASRFNAPYIIKANVTAGGRGKGKLSSGLQGGVQICSSPDQIKNFAAQMLGYRLVTKQTPPDGVPVDSVLVLESVDIARQLYLAFLLDRSVNGAAVIYSKHGGMDIEEVAEKHPEAVKVLPIDLKTGVTKEQAYKVAHDLEFDVSEVEEAAQQVIDLGRLFFKEDCLQVEINPWATTPDKKVFCVDSKVTIDDNALFRHKNILETEGPSDLDESEIRANKAGINYVKMNGNIGCLVNGAGLAMATMDLIQLKGGSPANFLDVGGGANISQMKEAFSILFSHPKVASIFVNIFGGILRCDDIARALMQVKQEIGFPRPVVIRLQGTNAHEGKKIIDEHSRGDPHLHVENHMEEAASKSIKLAS
jgi:succinyl-CoA synthetase beta subunit